MVDEETSGRIQMITILTPFPMAITVSIVLWFFDHLGPADLFINLYDSTKVDEYAGLCYVFSQGDTGL